MEKHKKTTIEEEKDVQEIGLGKILDKKDIVMRTEELVEEPKNARMNPNANREELNKLPSTTKNTV